MYKRQSDGADASSTVDYRSHREDSEADEDEESDLHSFFEELVKQEEMLKAAEEDARAGGCFQLQAYLQKHGTQTQHGPTEILDGNRGAEECWTSTEPDMRHLAVNSGDSSRADPIEVQLTPQMSLLLMPTDCESLPKPEHHVEHHDDYCVVLCLSLIHI